MRWMVCPSGTWPDATDTGGGMSSPARDRIVSFSSLSFADAANHDEEQGGGLRIS